VTLIWLGALLVVGGVLQMALSSAAERDFARDSATPGTRKTGPVAFGIKSNWPGLAMVALGAAILLAGTAL
jgi:hypothetical protein